MLTYRLQFRINKEQQRCVCVLAREGRSGGFAKVDMCLEANANEPDATLIQRGRDIIAARAARRTATESFRDVDPIDFDEAGVEI